MSSSGTSLTNFKSLPDLQTLSVVEPRVLLTRFKPTGTSMFLPNFNDLGLPVEDSNWSSVVDSKNSTVTPTNEPEDQDGDEKSESNMVHPSNNETVPIPEFKTLKVTTITSIAHLTGPERDPSTEATGLPLIDINVAFHLLPITRIVVPNTRRQTKKCKIPPCDKPGSLVSIRYQGATRGLVRSTSKVNFSHSVTIDLSTSKKNISAKLAPKTIHMCGADSDETPLEAAQYLVAYCIQIQKCLNLIQAHLPAARALIEYLSQKVSGPPVTRSIIEKMGALMVHKEITENTLRPYTDEAKTFIEEYHNYLTIYYETNKNRKFIRGGNLVPFDDKARLLELANNDLLQVRDFYLSQAAEYTYARDFKDKIQWITNECTYICDLGISIESVNKVMVNYNHDLGFSINRYSLTKLITGQDGFIARYNNAVHHSVMIEFPVVIESNPESVHRAKKKSKKGTQPCCTILAYRSGACTISYKDPKIIEDVYYRFMRLVRSFGAEIVGTSMPKRRPVKPRK